MLMDVDAFNSFFDAFPVDLDSSLDRIDSLSLDDLRSASTEAED